MKKKAIIKILIAIAIVAAVVGAIVFFANRQPSKEVTVVPVTNVYTTYWGDSKTLDGYVTTGSLQEVYMTEGGTPHLDGQYTVFGEVVEGLDIVGKIQGVITDDLDRPLVDVRILKAERVK